MPLLFPFSAAEERKAFPERIPPLKWSLLSLSFPIDRTVFPAIKESRFFSVAQVRSSFLPPLRGPWVLSFFFFTRAPSAPFLGHLLICPRYKRRLSMLHSPTSAREKIRISQQHALSLPFRKLALLLPAGPSLVEGPLFFFFFFSVEGLHSPFQAVDRLSLPNPSFLHNGDRPSERELEGTPGPDFFSLWVFDNFFTTDEASFPRHHLPERSVLVTILPLQMKASRRAKGIR